MIMLFIFFILNCLITLLVSIKLILILSPRIHQKQTFTPPAEPFITAPQSSLNLQKISQRLLSKKEPSNEEWCRLFDLLIYSLQGGIDLRQALSSVLVHLQGPLKKQLHLTIQEWQLGTPLLDALHHWHQRHPSAILERFTFLIELQHSTGGDLIRLLQLWTPQVRQQERLFNDIQQNTKEARLSGIILSALTPLIGLLMLLLQPQLWSTTLHHSLGRKLLFIAIGLWLVGVLWIRRLTRLKE